MLCAIYEELVELGNLELLHSTPTRTDFKSESLNMSVYVITGVSSGIGVSLPALSPMASV